MQNVRGRLQRHAVCRFISGLIAFILTFSLIIPPQTILAQNFGPGSLPVPGTLIAPTQGFVPTLIKGIEFHPENPFQLDFILHTGEESLQGEALNAEALRVIKYFLASLTVPEDQMWVNLSPYEKDRIIPEAFGQTGMGLDLLAEDYLLKQLTASLVYPEQELGQKFWQRMKERARAEYGLTQLPSDAFHKVWIVAKDAQVLEQGSRAFVINSSLEVLTEEDYTAAKEMLGQTASTAEAPQNALSRLQTEVMRELILPEIEREVNEGRSFARLRQIYNAMILAAWFKITLKESLLGQVYADQNKTVGVEGADQAIDRDTVYQQYLKAFEQGVYNYIREEQDPETGEVIPRQYFSGGAVPSQTRDGDSLTNLVARNTISGDPASDNADISHPEEQQLIRKLSHELGTDTVRAVVDLRSPGGQKDQALLVSKGHGILHEDLKNWNRLDRPNEIYDEIMKLRREPGDFDEEGVLAVIKRYAEQVAAQDLYRVQSAWPVLKALTLLDKEDEQAIVSILQKAYEKKHRPMLVDNILLMNDIVAPNWIEDQAPSLKGRMIYYVAAEVHHWAGGLGPVSKFHGQGMKVLGADISYVTPGYAMRQDQEPPTPLDYTSPNEGLSGIVERYDEYTIEMGDRDGHTVRKVKVRVDKGTDENGITTYLIRDIQQNGGSHYTHMLYNYGERNPATQEEFTAFFNRAADVFLERQEQRRREESRDDWKPAVIHSNDGQTAPLKAVSLSRQERSEGYSALKDAYWHFTTHTYLNRGNSELDRLWTFLKHMMGIGPKYISAFLHFHSIDHSSSGIRLADSVNGVSNRHRDDVSPKDSNDKIVAITNGAVPEDSAKFFRQTFVKMKEDGRLPEDADFERPTPEQVRLVKQQCKVNLNALQIPTANGGVLEVDVTQPLIGYSRRLVPEKAGRQRAFTDENIRSLVQMGFNVVFLGANQGSASAALVDGLTKLEKQIAQEKAENPDKFPGRFIFVDRFTPEQKKAFMAAEDVQVQDSDNHTGAAEYTEEDITANGGLQAGPSYREGIIVDQGIQMDFDTPGVGNTMVPAKDTPKSWLETVYQPLKNLWDKDRDHSEFYSHAAISPRINRVLGYLMSSAAYLRTYHQGIVERDFYEEGAEQGAQSIASSLAAYPQVVSQILKEGRGGISYPYEFTLIDQRKFSAGEKGLKAFVSTKAALEDEFAFDAFLGDYMNGHFEKYLSALFSASAASSSMDGYLKDLRESGLSLHEKYRYLGYFLEQVVRELEELQKPWDSRDKASSAHVFQGNDADAAAMPNPTGGIDFAAGFLNLQIKRDQSGMPLPAAQQPMQKLMTIEGLTPVIIQIAPVQNLPLLMGLESDEDSDDSGSANRLSRLDAFDKVSL